MNREALVKLVTEVKGLPRQEARSMIERTALEALQNEGLEVQYVGLLAAGNGWIFESSNEADREAVINWFTANGYQCIERSYDEVMKIYEGTVELQ